MNKNLIKDEIDLLKLKIKDLEEAIVSDSYVHLILRSIELSLESIKTIVKNK